MKDRKEVTDEMKAGREKERESNQSQTRLEGLDMLLTRQPTLCRPLAPVVFLR